MSALRVLHVPFTFHPDPCSGTEVFVQALCRELQEFDLEGFITAQGSKMESYRKHFTLTRHSRAGR